MATYDYEKAVREDVMEWLDENGERIATGPFGEVEYDKAYEEMLNDDSVTGNASGSYTFNRWKAEENICHNFDLLSEVVEENGGYAGNLLRSAEDADVMIRCHVLGQVLQDCLDEWNEKHATDGEDELEEWEEGKDAE